jgi:pilus assembly protein Flp/PilA
VFSRKFDGRFLPIFGSCWRIRRSDVGGNAPITLGEQLMSMFKRFLRDDSGATAIEYGLIAAGISVVIIGAVNTLGKKLNTTFTSVSNQLG